ncbi:MAG: hypothetical protein ABJF10_01840 [Chthoniobacter sp.]|uniref:hypothetical protein n=1 Tax=Chthoniobacter sp. TaxID=2510640 RepID=UPI0032A57868
MEKAAECPAKHLETVAVVDTFRGQTMWEGAVEVFELVGHPKARRAYGWIDGKGKDRRFTAVLEIPPVKDALTAVRAAIVSQAKK